MPVARLSGAVVRLARLLGAAGVLRCWFSQALQGWRPYQSSWRAPSAPNLCRCRSLVLEPWLSTSNPFILSRQSVKRGLLGNKNHTHARFAPFAASANATTTTTTTPPAPTREQPRRHHRQIAVHTYASDQSPGNPTGSWLSLISGPGPRHARIHSPRDTDINISYVLGCRELRLVAGARPHWSPRTQQT